MTWTHRDCDVMAGRRVTCRETCRQSLHQSLQLFSVPRCRSRDARQGRRQREFAVRAVRHTRLGEPRGGRDCQAVHEATTRGRKKEKLVSKETNLLQGLFYTSQLSVGRSEGLGGGYRWTTPAGRLVFTIHLRSSDASVTPRSSDVDQYVCNYGLKSEFLFFLLVFLLFFTLSLTHTRGDPTHRRRHTEVPGHS